jgi:O-antigen ligase
MNMTTFSASFREKPWLVSAMIALTVYAFGLPLSISITESGLFLAFACALIAVVRGETDIRSRLAALWKDEFVIQAWLVYFAAAVLASLFAIYPSRSWHYLFNDSLKPIVCIFLMVTLDKKFLPLVLGGLILGVVLFCFNGDIRTIADFRRTLEISRGFFYGGAREIVALVFCLVLKFFLEDENWFSSPWFLSVLLISLSGIIISQTRSAMACAVTGAVVFFILGMRRYGRWFAVALVAMLLMLCVVTFSAKFRYRLQSIFPALATIAAPHSVVKVDPALQDRREQWMAAYQMFKDHMITGVGPNNCIATFHFYHPKPIDGSYGWTAHNLYINQAAERGLPGLFALLFVFYALFRISWHNFTRGGDSRYALVGIAVLAGFVVMCVTGEPLQDVQESGALFLILAAGMPDPGLHLAKKSRGN